MNADPARLDELRREIRRLDREIIAMVSERLAAAREIGTLKRAGGIPLRNYSVEAEVIREVRARSAELKLDPALGEEIAKTLIRASLRAQEEDGR